MKHIGAGIGVAALYAFIAFIVIFRDGGNGDDGAIVGIFFLGLIIFALNCTWKLVESAINSGD